MFCPWRAFSINDGQNRGVSKPNQNCPNLPMSVASEAALLYGVCPQSQAACFAAGEVGPEAIVSVRLLTTNKLSRVQ